MKAKLFNAFSSVVLSRWQCLCIGAFVMVAGMVHPQRVLDEWKK